MNNFKIHIHKLLITIVLLSISSLSFGGGNNYRKVIDLSGDWKFSIGDKPEWAAAEFDDSKWENIDVPGRWENEGYYGYDGYAWYRREFSIKDEIGKIQYFLSLGYIDDVDEVFINGILIGKTGAFPPNYGTAFNARRFYLIPDNLLKANGANVIAVRVFDEGGEGGIVHGDIGIVADLSAIPVDFNLQGEWSFITENVQVKENDYIYFSDWGKITVPDMWENQGYKNYDGYGTYAVSFKLDGQFVNDKMVLVLGKIDDIEEVYLNGVLVGQLGELNRETAHFYTYAHQQLRGYYLNENVLNHSGENVLVVKVLDVGGIGGIYEGSVGLIIQDNYIKYWNRKRSMQ